MEPLLGTFGTYLAGGVVWGLWHFPNDIANYLNGYVSLPDAMQNASERMVILILLGVPLMWVTKKTDSVWPAVILHFVYNSSISVVRNILLLGGMPENYETKGNEKIITKICEYAPLVLLALIFMVLLLRNNRKGNDSK